jgi:formamidopyrimidine-DNA glycosylase
MPELPEVERAVVLARDVAQARVIISVRALHLAQRRSLPLTASRSLVGERVSRIDRRGKVQLFRLTSGRSLAVHFRMTGDWVRDRVDDPLPRHARAVLEFDDGGRLVLDDPRALSVLAVIQGDDSLRAMGPDANDPAFNASWLRSALARRRGAIKLALLDQRVVAGLGNIYAAESLWRARIDPRTPAHRLGAQRLTRLVRAIRGVIHRALQRDAERYREDKSAGKRPRFNVYDREGESCSRCRGTIRRIVQGARSTYYCPRCQR